jgi:hypothetical protein
MVIKKGGMKQVSLKPNSQMNVFRILVTSKQTFCQFGLMIGACYD